MPASDQRHTHQTLPVCEWPAASAGAGKALTGRLFARCVSVLLAGALVAGCATSGSVQEPVQAPDVPATSTAPAAQPVTVAPRSVRDAVAELQRVDEERSSGSGGGAQTQIGRYTSQDALPPESAAEPLEVYARLNFPRSTVRTVGDAIGHVLLRTGYRLVDASRLGEYEREFLALPLPEHQRAIGPYQVRTILQTLLGPAWQLRRDPITRDVWFTVSESHVALIEARRHADQVAQAPQASTRSLQAQGPSLQAPSAPASMPQATSATTGPRLPATASAPASKPTPVPGAAPLLLQPTASANGAPVSPQR